MSHLPVAAELEGHSGWCTEWLALGHLSSVASQEVRGVAVLGRNPCAKAPYRTDCREYHAQCSSAVGSPLHMSERRQGLPRQHRVRTMSPTVRKRFIVWHTVRVDSSCAHVPTRGPHSKLCATIRGPPCKQGATFTTLHVFSFDFETRIHNSQQHNDTQ